MRFRPATVADHPLLAERIEFPGLEPFPSITEAFVTDNEEGQRYWVVVRPYTFGQYRLQVWNERVRGETFPDIFQEL